MGPAHEDLPVLSFGSREQWEAWLSEHLEDPAGVWLKIGKKGASTRTVTYAEALEVALCYGWIDGQKDRLDADCWLQRFGPRRAGSRWSKVNRDKALELIERGEMRPAGLAQVERARRDGRWDAAYDGQRTATVPADLEEALAANERARAFFATLDSRNRYAILYRLADARRPETRSAGCGSSSPCSARAGRSTPDRPPPRDSPKASVQRPPSRGATRLRRSRARISITRPAATGKTTP
jgi:uncharacterized protein YdeI (YjbR/CyaY-like superfamily)